MNKNNRPVGRQKRVGSGSGNVQKRGSGLSGRTGGPVGDSGSYSDRTGSSPVNHRGGGYPSGGGSVFSGGGCLKFIGILIFIVVAIYYIYNNLGGGLGDLTGSDGTGSPDFQSGTPTSTTSYTDKGAYPVVTSVSELCAR
jgi:hypothetical protein